MVSVWCWVALAGVWCGGRAAASEATEWRVAELPVDRPFSPSDFQLVASSPAPSESSLKDGEALFEMMYASIDGATRVWVDGGGDAQGWGFFKKLQKKVGDTMFTFGAVMRCVASRHPQWTAGEIGVGAAPMKSFNVLNPETSRLRKALGTIAPSHELSILGTTTGLTAHLAIDKLAPPGDAGVVYVSAAAGGVGMLAVQLFALRNATKIIGSAGTDAKVALLRNKYGVDAFNYKRQSLSEALAEKAPEGIDVFFDNVGGSQLDATLMHMKKFGTVIACGAVSEYSSSSKSSGGAGLKNVHAISDRSISLRGFIVPDFAADFASGRQWLANQLLAGGLTTEETIFPWEEFGAAHAALATGANTGKVLVAGPAAFAAPSHGTSVIDFVTKLGAELGRDTSSLGELLVNEHWIDSVDALTAMQPPELISLGVPARLAWLIAARAGSGSAESAPSASRGAAAAASSHSYFSRPSVPPTHSSPPSVRPINLYAGAAGADSSSAGSLDEAIAAALRFAGAAFGLTCDSMSVITGMCWSVLRNGAWMAMTAVLGLLFPCVLLLGLGRLVSITGALRHVAGAAKHVGAAGVRILPWSTMGSATRVVATACGTALALSIAAAVTLLRMVADAAVAAAPSAAATVAETAAAATSAVEAVAESAVAATAAANAVAASAPATPTATPSATPAKGGENSGASGRDKVTLGISSDDSDSALTPAAASEAGAPTRKGDYVFGSPSI